MLHFYFRNMMITIQLCDKFTTCISLLLQLAVRETYLAMNHGPSVKRCSFHANGGGA